MVLLENDTKAFLQKVYAPSASWQETLHTIAKLLPMPGDEPGKLCEDLAKERDDEIDEIFGK